MSQLNLVVQAIIAALTPFAEAGSESANEIVETLTSEATETPKGPWALASCKDFFVPWNKEIHTGSKTVSKDGTFGRRRNLEDDFFIATEGSWVDAHGLEAKLYELDENQVPQLVELSDAEMEQVEDEKPVKKTPPSKPGKKTPPSKPGKKTPPAKSTEESALRKETIVFINTLVKQHEVDYDMIIEVLLSPFKVVSFEELPEENYKEVHRDAKAWCSWYSLIAEYKAKFDAFDAKHSDDLVEEFDGLTVDMNQLSFTELSAVYDEVKELHDQWYAYYNEA